MEGAGTRTDKGSLPLASEARRQFWRQEESRWVEHSVLVARLEFKPCLYHCLAVVSLRKSF